MIVSENFLKSCRIFCIDYQQCFLNFLTKWNKIAFSEQLYRSSRSEVFGKKGILKTFAKVTAKLLSQSPFFNKVAGSGPQLY